MAPHRPGPPRPHSVREGGRVDEQNIPALALELERLAQDHDPAPDEYLLFPQKIGRRGGYPTYETGVVWEDRLSPLSISGIDKWFQRARARAGLDAASDKVLMHELRHSAGTHAQESGHDLVATQHMLRHKSAATTERTYVHLDRKVYVAGCSAACPTRCSWTARSNGNRVWLYHSFRPHPCTHLGDSTYFGTCL